MTAYEELLEFGGERIFDFLKNARLHESQFKYSEFNEVCYKKMYIENNQDSIKTVKELKEEIPELKDTCKGCGSYFMNPRNKSIKGLDVQFGRLLEDVIIDFLKTKYKLNVTHGDNSNKKYPDCMLLSGDKGILAYFEVKYHGAPFISAINKIGRYCYEGSATLDLNKLVKQIEIVESELDRPVFYLHWIDYPCLILAEEETQPIGLWGQRHKQYLKEHRHIVYTTMLIDGTLNRYLADINQQAEQMFHRLIEEMVQKQGVTEQLKAEQPMEWIGLMNNIQAYAREIVNNEIIFS